MSVISGYLQILVAATLATGTLNSGKRGLDKQTGSLAWSPMAT